MKTLRTYSTSAEAEMAQQRLAAEGVEAMVVGEATEEIGCAVTDGIRLEVEEAQADRAEQILKGQEQTDPLPEDFVPPAAEPAEVPGENAEQPDALWTVATYFIWGGVLALIAGGVWVLFNLLAGKAVTISLVRIIILYSTGAVLGLLAAIANLLSKGKASRDEE